MKSNTTLRQLVALLDNTLRPENFNDASHNGLQLENRQPITRILTGVDASLQLLETAVEVGAQCIVCHHGISWGNSLARLTELNYKIIAYALQHDIAIYASHLPLDAHPDYGNNARICRELGITRLQPAYEYNGTPIGFIGELPTSTPFHTFFKLIQAKIAPHARAESFNCQNIRTVGVVSGGASEMAAEAHALGLDLFITGEPSLQGYIVAENLRQPVVYAGHYATETFGVKALAELITRQAGIEATFHDFKLTY